VTRSKNSDLTESEFYGWILLIYQWNRWKSTGLQHPDLTVRIPPNLLTLVVTRSKAAASIALPTNLLPYTTTYCWWNYNKWTSAYQRALPLCKKNEIFIVQMLWMGAPSIHWEMRRWASLSDGNQSTCYCLSHYVIIVSKNEILDSKLLIKEIRVLLQCV
jgi:hypothetical protein